MLNKLLTRFLFFLVLIGATICVSAVGTYEEPKDFINRIYDNFPPKVSTLWIKKDLKEAIRKIVEHDLGVFRLRYWDKDGRTTWILEEIGKERPITTGIVVNNNKIELIKVLIFRESRGWEVRYPFFTDQFRDVELSPENKLTKTIDGISGATLSVRALKKVSRLALYLTQYVRNKDSK